MRQFHPPNGREPALIDPTRRRDGRRIVALFTPYRRRLAVVLTMIVAASGVSMLNPFLLRAALDDGILRHNDTKLTEMV
ncbi:MAG: hypothetical protein ACRDL8_13215, partial [Solirubrobacteraceae bacterium]